VETYTLAQKVVSTKGTGCCLKTDLESWNSRQQQHVVELSSSVHYVLLDVSGSSSFLHQILEEGGT
jgi:hypothetical protein